MTRDELLALIAALRAEAATYNDQVEGLADIARLNVSDETRGVVQNVREIVLTRVSLLYAAADGLQALLNHGYPSRLHSDVSDLVRADIAAQQRTIQAATVLFAREPAAALNLTAGEPEPK